MKNNSLLPDGYSRELESPFLDEASWEQENPFLSIYNNEMAALSPFLETEAHDFGQQVNGKGFTDDEEEDQEEGQDDEAYWLEEDEFAFEERGIIKGDNRSRVRDTTGVPWRWICKIQVKDNKGRDVFSGTGVMISDRHILTAAHSVYEAYKNMHLYTIIVTPAKNDLKEPFESFVIRSKPKIRREYLEKRKQYNSEASESLDWDYALLTLKKAIGKMPFSALNGDMLCHWASPQCGANTIFAQLDAGTLNGKAAYTAGYPGGKGGQQLWCAAGMLHTVDEKFRRMRITADTTKGQSGSPVWVMNNNRYCLVGIVVSAGANSNTVVRVTHELISQVQMWIKTDNGTQSTATEKEALTPFYREQAHDESLDTGRVEIMEAYEEFDDDISTEEEEYFDESEFFEELIAKIPETLLRKQIDEYYGLANSEYTLPNGTRAKARAVFIYGKSGTQGQAKINLQKALGKKSYLLHKRIIHLAVYGRAKPGEIATITQALIDAGQLDTVGIVSSAPSENTLLIRQLQQKIKIGIDCAGYVQFAFMFGFTKSDDDPLTQKSSEGRAGKKRRDLGLKPWKGNENLSSPPRTHFTEVGYLNGKTGDLFILKPKAGDWHTMLVVDHIISGTTHTFVVDASWGNDTFGNEYAGIARRELWYDSAKGEWWDLGPGDGVTIDGFSFKKGEKMYVNKIGPYDRHEIKGMYRFKRFAAQTEASEFADETFGYNAEETDYEDMDYEFTEEEYRNYESEDDGAEDDVESHEVDSELVDLAENIIAGEVARFEFQTSSGWTKYFSMTDIAKVLTVFKENDAAAKLNSVDRCSCIVMLNVALGQLLSLKLKSSRARGKSTRRVQMGNLTTETIEKAMAELLKRGNAVAPIVINFLDSRGRTAGTLKPQQLKTSVRDRVLADSRSEKCWFAFGMSIMDGYHSVLLLVDNSADDTKIYWFDQFTTGLNSKSDVTDTLDQRLTDKTQNWWQAVMDERKKGYNTMIRLWPLRKK